MGVELLILGLSGVLIPSVAFVMKRMFGRMDSINGQLGALERLVIDRTSNGDSPLSKQITREVGRLERRIERIEDRVNGVS